MRGRKPKPTALKIIQGNPGRRRINRDEPTPPALVGLGDPPQHLSRGALAQWLLIVPKMTEVGLVTALDLPLIENLCEALARQRDAQNSLDRGGLVIKTPHGPVVSPFEKIVRQCSALVIRLSDQLGLSPTSRSRLHIEKPAAPPDAIEQRFFSGWHR